MDDIRSGKGRDRSEMRITLRRALWIALFAAFASPAQALPDCGALRAALQGSVEVSDLENHLDGAEACQSALQLGGASSFHCQWGFSYRSKAGSDAFRAMDALLRQCLDAAPVDADGSPVNHPDSFDQRHYRATGFMLSLSLKDKAALARSFVFLGWAPEQ